MTIANYDIALSTLGGLGRVWSAAHHVIAAVVVAIAMLVAPQSMAAEPGRVKIAVFAFELDDRSAGGGIIAPDAIDTENLKLSTEAARRILSESGRYAVVDTSNVEAEAAAAGGMLRCNGCDGPLASKLGAEQSMIGVFARVNRTEFTLQILIRDAATNEIISNDFTGLRMGANYAWPRGVKWLMENKILARKARSP